MGIKQDIEEAERTHFSQSYKSSVVMCRRALQLDLEDKGGPAGTTLGPLLNWEREQDPRLLTERTDAQAQEIKDYGDGGAHRKEEIEPREAELMIFVTVQVLNELYQLA